MFITLATESGQPTIFLVIVIADPSSCTDPLTLQCFLWEVAAVQTTASPVILSQLTLLCSSSRFPKKSQFSCQENLWCRFFAVCDSVDILLRDPPLFNGLKIQRAVVCKCLTRRTPRRFARPLHGSKFMVSVCSECGCVHSFA